MDYVQGSRQYGRYIVFTKTLLMFIIASQCIFFPHVAKSAAQSTHLSASQIPLDQPIIFVHGLFQDARLIGTPRTDPSKNAFVPLYRELRMYYGSVHTFWYLDDIGFADGIDKQSQCPSSYASCLSQSSVTDNAMKLDQRIRDLYTSSRHQVALIGYSMGAAIIRTALAGCPPIVTCQANLNANIAEMVNDVFFIAGVQQGSWLAGAVDSVQAGIDASVAALLNFQPSLKVRWGLGGQAAIDLKPQSSNITIHNSSIPPSHIRYFNFYGDLQFSWKNCAFVIYCIEGKPVSIGDGIILPGTDNPRDTPLWGGARFCFQCNGNNFSQIDADTSYTQWPLQGELSINYQDLLVCAVNLVCIARNLVDLLTTAPQMHLNIPSDASLDGSAIQVQDTTGTSGSQTTSIAHEIALQLEAMPHTQTDCPITGPARGAVTRPLALGKDQNIVYVKNSKNNDGTPLFSTLYRYDLTTNQTTLILQKDNADISSAEVSTDGQWVTFISEVSSLPAIQMVRMDGQGLQTLYCIPPTQDSSGAFIENVLLSPDQKQLTFVIAVNYNTFSLLDMTNGTIQTELQPTSGSSAFYQPIMWLNNTQLYLWQYPIMQSAIFLLDTQNGPNQPDSALIDIADSASLKVFDVSPDRTTLFTSRCQVCGQGIFIGPSDISAQSATNPGQHTIYSDSAGFINDLLAAPNNTLLFSIISSSLDANRPADTSQNGIWKMNFDGSGATRLFNNGLGFAVGGHQDISNDGKWYLLSSNTSLFFTSLNGGSPTQFVSIMQASGLSLGAIGWTTM